MAKSEQPRLSQDGLAKIFRDADAMMQAHDFEHKNSVRIISALLELLGGQVVLPRHALKNAPGYQMLSGPTAGDITLQSMDPEGHH